MHLDMAKPLYKCHFWHTCGTNKEHFETRHQIKLSVYLKSKL